MSELQTYYDAFKTAYWADEDAAVCRCKGSGWVLSEVDTFHECPVHYDGQPNNESSEEECEAYELRKAREAYKAIASQSVAEFARFGVDAACFNRHVRRELAEGGAEGWIEAAQVVAEAFEQIHDYS